MPSSVKNFLIGLFMAAGITVLVGLVLFIRPRIGDEKQVLYVRFSDINKINVGTRVLFAGEPIGEVTEIEPIPHARETQPSDKLGRIYYYQLTLKIDSGIHVYNTDEINLQTSGLLGEKSVAIIPKAPPKGVTPIPVTEKTPFYANSVDPIENAINELADLGEKFTDWFDINSPNLTQSVTSLKDVLNDLSKGKGTFGKLITSDDMYLRLNAIMSKADTLMNDVNHYGILFHLNKGWQRTRTKRISVLEGVETPTEFKNFFQSEIDQINTAMARISMLINRAEEKDQTEILESQKFRDNFAELMREVQEMLDNLRLYNQQLTEALKQ